MNVQNAVHTKLIKEKKIKWEEDVGCDDYIGDDFTQWRRWLWWQHKTANE